MYPERQIFFVLGLSRSGKAAAEFLLSRGALVYIYDDVSGERVEKIARALEEQGAKRVDKENFSKMPELCDVLVLSPGIPIDHPIAVSFKRKGKAVVGETELAARYMRCPIVAVTGTNGKTTTVSMLAEIFKTDNVDAYACGNIGTPMIEFCNLCENSIAVAEISSFQMETLNSLCPHISVILNITEDHLNRHYNMENYIFLKAKLLKNASEAEYAVLNRDDTIVRGFAEKTKARIVWFSVRERVNGAYLENGTLFYNGEKIMEANELFADGLHNIQNALAAIASAKLMGVKTASIKKALRDFKGIKHRIEFVGEVNGVRYVDDSKGTNVDATVKAVGCMKTETLLLLGGKNKGYDYRKLFDVLKNSKVVHAVLYGENRYELLKCARERGFEGITVCENFAFAVQIASMKATRGQTVLLSPASASFDEFAGYEERGDDFVQIVRTLEESAKQNQEKTDKTETIPTTVAYENPVEEDDPNSADDANNANDTDGGTDSERFRADETE